MIVDPGKFQAIILDKRKGSHAKQTLNIDQKKFKAYQMLNF